MGEIYGDIENSAEMDSMKRATTPTMDVGKVETDVPGVFADGMKDQFPVFDVDDDEFYKNMRSDRKRMRFNTDNPVSQYLRQTRYNRPFFIKTKNGDYMRKIKS